MIWTLTPSYTKPPLTMNDRVNWRANMGTKATVRREAELLARTAGIPPLLHCHLRMIWTVPDQRVRDEENPVSTYKVFADGLVDAGIVPDDRPKYMTKYMPIIEYRKGMAAVRFEIEAA